MILPANTNIWKLFSWPQKLLNKELITNVDGTKTEAHTENKLEDAVP